MRSISEYQSNVADIYQEGTQVHRRLRKLLRHSQLDGHVVQIDNHAIGKANA